MHPIVQAKIGQIELVCRLNNVARLDVFGSAARSIDFEPGRSDIDLLVEFGPRAQGDTYIALKQAFEQILECPVDLVDRKALAKSRNYIRRANILADTQIVYRA